MKEFKTIKMKTRIALIIIVFVLISRTILHGQVIQRIEPPSWFTGLKDSFLQLMVYGEGIASYEVSVDYPGVYLTTLVKTENSNYLFINLNVGSETKPGIMNLRFKKEKNKIDREFRFYAKPEASARGFNSSDVIYLLMPDRFANGDLSNDSVKGMLEGCNRQNPGGRHGGDLKGISDHLDYISGLGVTGIWLNPFLENNQPVYSYHGYSTTDFYRVDPRYGTNEDFRQLVEKAHSKGLKVMMDMIFNHIGSGHWWMKDLPSRDWIHQFDEFTRTNYRTSVWMDPYASEKDINIMEKGWFDTSMPDLNQSNPLLAAYLIQNSIWWIAYSGIDGIRMDTYPYPEKEMMSRWAKRVTEEFPGFFIVGEVWYQQEALTAYWANGRHKTQGYVSNLPSVTDFPLSLSTHKAFTEPDSWDEGIARLYLVLSQDFLYSDPSVNVIFLDNHDLTRFFTQTGKNLQIYRMALAFIMTTRGIPQFYYGTEIVMEGDKKLGDGHLRADFPGGWPGDKKNVFSGANLNADEQEALSFTRKLINWRKGKEVIHSGSLRHFIPDNGLYVYFRYNDKESVMVAINNNPYGSRNIMAESYAECTKGFSKAYDIVSGREISDISSFTIGPKSVMILELK